MVFGSFFVPWTNLPSFRRTTAAVVQKSNTPIPGKTSTENQTSATKLTPNPVTSITQTLPPPVSGTENQPTPVSTTTGGDGQIAFASNRTGSFQIWVIDSDGSSQRQLTGMAGGACQPAWSPDGTQLAFISPCRGKKDQYDGARIFLSDADGKNPHTIPISNNSNGDFSPNWSPDGKMIAFASLRGDSKPHILTYNVGDSSVNTVTNSAFGDTNPVWAPSGLQIAFVRQFPNSQIWITDLTGQQQFQYSPSGAVINIWPEWNKDGSILYYSQMSPDATIPYLIGLTYENRGRNLEFRTPAIGTEDIGPIAKPSFSPDGQWIAYESWPDGINHDIYLMKVNGTERRRLTSDKDWDFDPSWRSIGQISP
jgi:eukaryotic-like serine/threonine-protein kinase